MTRKKTTGNKGFTIIEGAIAIIILLIGLLSVIEFFPFALKIINDSKRTTVAANLTMSKLEEVIALSYDEITVGTMEVKHRMSDDPGDYLYTYQRQTVIDYVDENLAVSASDIGLKKITVRVFWTSSVDAEEKSIEMDSLISEY